MTVNQTPLEKQLISVDLKKGLDERTRPELSGDITTLENLVQDQGGAWVKRPGTVMGPVSDGTSAQPSLPKKVIQLVNGWGVVADDGSLLHKLDYTSRMARGRRHQDFSAVSGSFVSSSGPNAQSGTQGGSVQAVASSSLFDCVLTFAGAVSLTQYLVISERATGIEYSYDLSKVTYPSGVAPTNNNRSRMVFVGDRYLHIYTVDASGTAHVYCTSIDTSLAMPVTAASMTANLVYTGGATETPLGAVGGASFSYLLKNNNSPTTVLYQQNPNGSNAFSYSPAAAYNALDVDDVTGRVWLSNAQVSMMAVSASNVSTVVVSAFIPGVITAASPVTTLGLCCVTSNGSQYIVTSGNTVFGAGLIRDLRVYTLASGSVVPVFVGAMYGWNVVSKPFYCEANGRVYIQLTKQDALSEISPVVIADLTSFTPFYTNTPAMALAYGSFRVAMTLEPMSGIQKLGIQSFNLAGGTYVYKSFGSGHEFSFALSYQTAQRVTASAFVRSRIRNSGAYGSANFSGSSHVAHGGLNAYDGRYLGDVGFSDQPTMDIATGAAGALTGSFRYVVVYRHVDANGASSYSRTVGPVAKVNSATRNTVTIQPHGLTNKDSGLGDSRPFVELYRTKSGGSQYYLCASSQEGMISSTTASVQQISASATTGLLSVTDNLADATLAAQAIMYRQPGTTNAAADRYPAPAGNLLVQHKDRLFCVDPYGQRVYYSSFFVDGEAAWFNPAFNFFIHGGTGPITALASLDGRLVVFKKDAVFTVDGDGPGEAGPTGNEYSPPTSIAARYGCTDHRSVVTTPDGIMYRSSRGFELLTRSLQVKYIGERVQESSEAYPVTTGSCISPDSRVHYTIAEAETAAGATGTGVELIYDLTSDCWSVAKHTGSTGVYGGCQQGCASITDAGVSRVAYADPVSGTYLGSDSVWTDNGVYVPWKMETGWFPPGGPQSRQRITDVLLLAKKRPAANHAIRISVAYDYSDTYTQINTWQPGEINNLTIEELALPLTVPMSKAFRFKFEDIVPTDTATYPIGTGAAGDLLSVTMQAAPMQNIAFGWRGGTSYNVPMLSGINPVTGSTGGGTAFTLYGRGLTGTTSVRLGSANATSVVVVSDNVVTGVTPAGALGAVDVTVVTPAGSAVLSGGFTYVSAVAFDPATLNLTGWWEAPYAGLPLVARASAFTSGVNGNLTTAGTDPTVGATLNGYATMDFNGVNSSARNIAVGISQIISPGRFSFVALVYPRSATAATLTTGASSYDDSGIVGDASANNGLVYTSNGLGLYTAAGGYQNFTIAAPVNNWYLVMGYRDLTTGGIIVNGTTVSGALGSISSLTHSDAMNVGIAYAGTSYLDARVAMIMTANTSLSASYANIRSYVNTRYALSL